MKKIVILVLFLIILLFSLSGCSEEIYCGNDNHCFLQNLELCEKGTLFENCNNLIGCQKAKIVGEEQGKCKVHRWDESLEGKQINIDKICLINKNYNPPHFWVTDGMC
jgi:hypothetical protein